MISNVNIIREIVLDKSKTNKTEFITYLNNKKEITEDELSNILSNKKYIKFYLYDYYIQLNTNIKIYSLEMIYKNFFGKIYSDFIKITCLE